LEQTMTNPNDTSTGTAAGVAQSDDSSPQASSPSVPFPAASLASAQSSGDVEAVAKSGAVAAQDAVDKTSRAGDAFVKRLVDGAHAAIDKLADAAGPAVDRLANTFANPSAKVSGLAGQVSDKKDKWVSDARDIIRENPLVAVATALAVGAICVQLRSSPRRHDRDLDE
jgi:hypothetical protein